MESLVFLGLVLIVAAWLFQLVAVMKGKKEIQTSFVISYMIGVAILVVDGFSSSQFTSGVLNSFALLASALVLFEARFAGKR